MKAPLEEGPLKEAAILTRAVENVFRKLIRLLIGRMSLTKLQEMIRYVFVEEAEKKFSKENPGENVTLSKLGVVTGLDTRTLKKVRRQIAGSAELTNQKFLEGFNPLLRTLDMWITDRRFINQSTGEPRTLDIEGSEQSPGFAQLIKESMPARGITTQAVMDRLSESGMVRIDRNARTIELKGHDSSFIRQKEMEMLEIGMDSISDLLSTVTFNIDLEDPRASRFFQREFWNYHMDWNELENIRSLIRRYLEQAEHEGRALLTSLAEQDAKPGQFTAGVGMYYFERPDESR